MATQMPNPTLGLVTGQEICQRCGHVPWACTCCDLVCFERPQYHCGHLLTDADLSLQVRYLVEKNKLRNRALHGHGVVCGLKLTCDPHCTGHIILHDGYAIDDCGNDIVVCEKEQFDVIGALRAKRLIHAEHRRDPCEPEWEGRECRIKECFHIIICYNEEDCEYETPFQTGCATSPQDCVPTRTRETFRVEVTDRLPEEKGYLDWLEERLKHCFRLFRDSPVGRIMKQEAHRLRAIIECRPCKDREERRCHCELFRLLRGHFVELMKHCPDELDCCLIHEVECLHCPEWDRDEYEKQICACFCRLFESMLRYQYDCVLSDLVFCCIETPRTCCVVLGSVEIVDGCLVRVCNTPRRYVWSFANLLPLAIGAILTGSLMAERKRQHEGQDGEHHHHQRCCPDYGPLDCDLFLREFEMDGSARYKAATAILEAAKTAYGSLTEGFAFARSGAVSPSVFIHHHVEEAKRRAESIGLRAEVDGEPPWLDPMQAFLSQMLLRPGDLVKFFTDADGRVREARPASRPETEEVTGMPPVDEPEGEPGPDGRPVTPRRRPGRRT